MNHTTTANKILSVTLSLALAATAAPWPAQGAPVSGVPAFAAKLTPPEQFGYVASSYAPKGDERPRLIVIADLHGHVEVQKNIMGMLSGLVGKLTDGKAFSAQTRVPIFVEGGWEKNLEQPLKPVADAKVRAFLGEYLLQKAEIPAVQAFSEKERSAPITLTGVENKEDYEANRAKFVQTYPVRRQILSALARQEESLAVLRKHVLSGRVQKLYAMRRRYEKGMESPERYARALVRFAAKTGVQNRSVTLLQDYRKNKIYTGELELAFAEVYRQVADRLASDKPARAYVRRGLKNEATIRQNLVFIDSMMDLLKRTVSNQLTPDEVPYALANMARLVQVAQILLKDEKLDVDLSSALMRCLEFYPFAFLRDEILLDNSLAELKKDETRPATGILVTGGFHVEAMAARLREQKVPYLVLHPVITRDLHVYEHLNYVKRMCDEHVTPEELASDLRRPWAARDLSASAIDMGPVTGTAAPVDPGKVGQYTTLANIGKDAIYAHLGQKDVAKGLGITYTDGSVDFVETAIATELEGRKAAIEKAAAANQVQIGKVKLADGITLRRNASTGLYEAFGANAAAYVGYLNAINEVLGQVDPNDLTGQDEIILQPVRGKITAQATVIRNGVSETVAPKETDAVAVNLGEKGVPPILLINDEILASAGDGKLESAAKGLNAGRVTSDISATMIAALKTIHEMIHPATKSGLQGFAQEGAVIKNSLVVLIKHAADLAGYDTVGAGIPTFFVGKMLEALQGEISPEQRQSILAAVRAVSPNGKVPVKGLAQAISDVIDPSELKKQAVQAIMDEMAERGYSQVPRERIEKYVSENASVAFMSKIDPEGTKKSGARRAVTKLFADAATWTSN